ncbi:MAG: hypothetical protein GEU88_09180 [Solirubrobacterales bacterium]|nr:hypothetical protein [Solirubrobacterales bacterium]
MSRIGACMTAGGRRSGRPIVALALTVVLFAGLAGEAAAKPGSGEVRVRIKTESQHALFAKRSPKLTVRLRAHRRLRVALRVRAGKVRRLTKHRTVTVRGGGKRKTVRLRLNRRGRERLGRCGSPRAVVAAKFRHGGQKRRSTSRDKRRLKRDAGRCRGGGGGSPPGGGGGGGGGGGSEPPPRCDPIDQAACMLPFPNDFFTTRDESTATGLRLDLQPGAMPKNLNGVSTFSPELNRNDGFSPNSIIVTRVPGIETPAAFRANHLVAQMNIGAYDEPDQRVVLIDTETGERVPIWAELDMVPGTVNPHNGGKVEGTANDRLLLIHPAVALDPGTRYAVALRNLTDAGGNPLAPNPIFRAYRDGEPTGDAALEARRPRIERVISDLERAGIARRDLYLAWDFTVASERNLTERLIAMRDDAFAQLGDTELADGAVQGRAPELEITGERRYALCDSDGTPECELTADPPQSDYAFKKVTGTVTVPCYMNAPGAEYNPTDPDTPCATGSRLHYEGGSSLPSQGSDDGRPATWEAPFTCIIPRTGVEADRMATGMPGIYFGHGLFQNNRVVEQLGLFPGSLEGVACGGDWIGLSAIDPVTGEPYPGNDLNYLANMIAVKKDLSLFSALPDRSQQGFVDALYLARAMAHPDGLADEPEFRAGGTSALAIDPQDTAADLSYYGVSLGGIFGAATTAVAPDWQRAVLGVPGMGFTTLLLRSTQFNQFLPLIYSAYPDPLERQLGISILQLVWDRGEPSSYAHGILDGRYGTPRHQAMIHEAFGDHQVANVQTETLARTLGAAVRTPTLAGGRLESRDYLFTDVVAPFYLPSQQLLDHPAFERPGGFDGPASMFTIDTGSIRREGGEFVGTNPNLDWNIAPVDATNTEPNDGLDPHQPAATSPAAQQTAIPFLLGQGVYDPCVDPEPGEIPPFAVPYSGTPEACSAPPRNSIGQGE